jgi:hypothetical protein
VGRAIPAQVTLESVAGMQVGSLNADAEGKFVFPKVPPGAYVVKAMSKELLGGRRREASSNISVNPRPAPPTLVPPLSLR